jgi:hypothetical protein
MFIDSCRVGTTERTNKVTMIMLCIESEVLLISTTNTITQLVPVSPFLRQSLLWNEILLHENYRALNPLGVERRRNKNNNALVVEGNAAGTLFKYAQMMVYDV